MARRAMPCRGLLSDPTHAHTKIGMAALPWLGAGTGKKDRSAETLLGLPQDRPPASKRIPTSILGCAEVDDHRLTCPLLSKLSCVWKRKRKKEKKEKEKKEKKEKEKKEQKANKRVVINA
ncbi:hypothetical protein ColLi_07635 [Colletotrichum liriopes]|uniref:Uncharacterized protein n=1 Tax=Colletotrichum liriopes TaxID=708192 RepID=A0AA37GQQ0_9PEZI|nr:hypothetical protein ColLi_07635 [Colletotrichum liriopes]